MTASEFMGMAPMFASEDGSRKSLGNSFRHGNHMFVTDGRIALIGSASGLDADEIRVTADPSQKNVGSRLLDEHLMLVEAKIDNGAYLEYDLCSIGEAVCEVFASIEPEMMYLRMNEPDPEYLDHDVKPESVRNVHDKFSVVIMANPARSVISGYYASLIAGLVKYYGPVVAFADKDNPHAELYFRGDNWDCILMPRRVKFQSDSHWDSYLGCAIADAESGKLVHARGSTNNIDELRFCGRKQKGRAKCEN